MYICLCKFYSQLRDGFIQTLTTGYSHYDRQLRNDLLTLTTLIASKSTKAPFLESGFVKQLALFSTFQEGESLHLQMLSNLCCGVNIVVLQCGCKYVCVFFYRTIM